ncbi:MAG TPA: hypothetical protein VF490_09705 [Chryseosolibacter sp.]
MKIIRYFTAALLCAFALSAYSQADSTRYINGLPVPENDTTTNFPKDLPPDNRMVPVDISQLPPGVLNALRKEDQYKGWQDTTIYHDANAGLYFVPLRYEEGIRIFGLNDQGNAVTYNEVITRKEE